MTAKTVKTIDALEGEIVEVRWIVPEGKFWQRATCPPKPVRDRRIELKTDPTSSVDEFIKPGAVGVVELTQIAKPDPGTVLVVRIGPAVEKETLDAIIEGIESSEAFKGVPYLVVPNDVAIDSATRAEIFKFLDEHPE